MEQERPQPIAALLRYLAGEPGDGTWGGWRVEAVRRGMNRRLYRATSSAHDLAVKFAIRDERDRAGREWKALLALQDAGLAIAPAPVLLDREGFGQPVIVQCWLAGEVCNTPPESDEAWTALLTHYAAIHSLQASEHAPVLARGVVNFASTDEGRRHVAAQLERLPPGAAPAQLLALAAAAERVAWLRLAPTPFSLCRVDANVRNFIRQEQGWASVDWENSGWGDPACEIAELLCHPSYEGVSAARRAWVIERYCALCGDAARALRIRCYVPLMLLWWSARLARKLYEAPRSLDRPNSRSPKPENKARALLERYIRRTDAAIRHWKIGDYHDEE